MLFGSALATLVITCASLQSVQAITHKGCAEIDPAGQYVKNGAAGATMKYNATYLCIWTDILNGTLVEEIITPVNTSIMMIDGAIIPNIYAQGPDPEDWFNHTRKIGETIESTITFNIKLPGGGGMGASYKVASATANDAQRSKTAGSGVVALSTVALFALNVL